MKKLFKIVAVLFVIMAAALIVLYLSLGGIVRKAVEAAGTSALATPVRVAGTKIDLFGQKVEVKGLQVANPEEFEQPDALSLGRFEVAASIPSFLRDVIDVSEIQVEELHLTVEQKGLKTNVGVLLDNLEGEPAAEAPPEKEAPPEPEKKGPEKRFKIALMRIAGTKVTLGSSLLSGEAKEVAIPDIEIRDIGTGPDGPVPLSKVLTTILRRILKEAIGDKVAMPEAARKLLSGEAKLGDAIHGATESVEKALGVDKAPEGAKKAVEGIKNLFGGKKE
ncbi:MAG: hypothetical protein JXP34_11250 [Planctomycetes bacterium]|nr:hypothetical protein [Planctomycetota bacterium]